MRELKYEIIVSENELMLFQYKPDPDGIMSMQE